MRHFFLFLLTSLIPLQFAETAVECTLSMIKPDAVCNNHSGKIISRLEKNSLHLAAIKMVQVTKAQAKRFYKEHEKRPFYDDLTDFLSSGPVIVMVLKGDDAIKKNREIMGATDPKEAKPGTLRYDFATSKQRNAVHGSDSLLSAEREIAFFFKPQEIYSKKI